MRRKQSSAVLPVIGVGMIGFFLVVVYFSVLGPFPISPITRLGQPTPTPTPLTFEAEQAVRAMYDAITAKRPDDYVKLVLPRKHTVVQPMNVLRAITIGGNVGAFGFSVDLDKLENTMYYSITTAGHLQTDIYVLVEARGTAKYTVMDRDVDFCDEWDVRREGNKWLVDVEAQERQARLERLVSERLAKYPVLAWLRTQLGITIDLDGILMQFGVADEELYDMCE